MPLCPTELDQHERRGAVVDAGRIARCHRAVLAKCGLEPGERFERRLRARVFVARDEQRVALFLRDRDGHDLLVEPAGVHRPLAALLALDGEAVLIFARDREALRHVFGRFAHAVGLIHLGQARVGEAPADGRIEHFGRALPGLGGFGHDERGTGHALDAAGDDDVGAAAFDRACGDVDGFEAGGAQSVHRAAGHAVGQAGEQGGHAGDVAVVLAGLVRGAEIDVVDDGGVDSAAADGFADDEGGQVVGANSGEASAIAGEGRSHGGDDGGSAWVAHAGIISGEEGSRV